MQSYTVSILSYTIGILTPGSGYTELRKESDSCILRTWGQDTYSVTLYAQNLWSGYLQCNAVYSEPRVRILTV